MAKRRLTRKQLVEQIRSTMPDNLSELEIAAFIEKSIADNVVFDEGYLWGNKETRKKIYTLAKEEARRPNQKFKRKLICITMAELYVYIAREFGLDVGYQMKSEEDYYKIGHDNILQEIDRQKRVHLCPVLKLKDGRIIKIDIERDLKNLQTRSKTKFFGKRHGNPELDELSSEEVNSIFRKIYGLKEQEEFTDDYIKSLNIDMSRKRPIDRIKTIIEDNRIQKELQFSGCVEATKMCETILEQVFNGFLEGLTTTASISTCSLEAPCQAKKYSVLLYARDRKEKVFYIFSKKSSRMVPISPKELKQMEDMSMVTLHKKIKKTIKKSYSLDNNIQTTNILDVNNFFLDDDEQEQ